MKHIKRFILRVAFATEIFMFLFFYSFGVNGLSAIYRLKQENHELRDQIKGEHRRIEKLKDECLSWDTSSFYQEKVAREKLQMIKKGEVIYFYS